MQSLRRIFYHRQSLTGWVLLWFSVLFLLWQNTFALTLNECYELALKQSENLKIQSEKIDQLKWRTRQALGAVFPQTSFHASQFYQDAGGRDDRGLGFTLRERPELKFTLQQTLFSGFREFAALSSLKAEQSAETELLNRFKKLLYLDVAQAFYLVLKMEKDMENLDALITLTQERIRELKERERLGKSRKSESLSAESQLYFLQAQRAQIQKENFVARELLSYLTAKEFLEEKIEDTVMELSEEVSENEFLLKADARSDLNALKKEVEAKHQELRLRKGALYPTASLTGNYYMKRVGAQENIDWDILLSLDLPLFQGGAVRAQVKESISRLRETQLRLIQKKREILSEIRDAVQRLNASIAESKNLRSAFEKAKESYELHLREYRLGLVNNLEVLQSMNTMQERKRDWDRSLLQTKLYYLELKVATEELP